MTFTSYSAFLNDVICPQYRNEDNSYRCRECAKKFNMPLWDICCLNECGQHEFCRNCEKGIYSNEFKQQMKGHKVATFSYERSMSL